MKYSPICCFWTLSHDVPFPSGRDSKRRTIIILDKYDATRTKDKTVAKFTEKADKVRINWGVAGRGEYIKSKRLWLNVEEDGQQ